MAIFIIPAFALIHAETLADAEDKFCTMQINAVHNAFGSLLQDELIHPKDIGDNDEGVSLLDYYSPEELK